MNDDSKLYELAGKVFDAFNEFLVERNNSLGISSPISYISDEDGRTVIFTRGEYAEDLIDGINKLHGLDPLKHRAFETATQLANTANLVDELVKREGITRIDLPDKEWVFEGKFGHPVEESSAKIPPIYGPARIIVVHEES